MIDFEENNYKFMKSKKNLKKFSDNEKSLKKASESKNKLESLIYQMKEKREDSTFLKFGSEFEHERIAQLSEEVNKIKYY